MNLVRWFKTIITSSRISTFLRPSGVPGLIKGGNTMGGLSWWHWLIIIAAFILLFGAKKLPDAARGVGRSLRILKSEVAAMTEDQNKDEGLDPHRLVGSAGHSDLVAPIPARAGERAADPQEV
jgi:sec-independent protein translocase protein TatA